MGWCTVSGCGKRVLAQGYCGSHYQRWRRHGDPLIAFTDAGAVQRHFSEVVMRYEGDECLTWPFGKAERPSARINGRQKVSAVARIVCEEQNGPAPTGKHEAAHSCGNKWCVNRRHIRWATRGENAADKVLHGTSNRGTNHYNARLTEDEALEIKRLKGAVSQSNLAARYGVSEGAVANIHSGKTWGWLSC